MAEKSILIPVRLDAAAFQEFALFDTFLRRGTLRRIALFAGPLLAAACACFAFGGAGGQGALLGGALLAVGLVLPAVYLLNFFKDVKTKSAQLGLDKPKLVYTVRLGEAAVSFCPAHPGKAPGGAAPAQQGEANTPWPQVYGAWRTREAVYLYTAENTACLLPAGQASVPDEELWAFIAAHLDPKKLHDRRRF